MVAPRRAAARLSFGNRRRLRAPESAGDQENRQEVSEPSVDLDVIE
jgi:hypothetical protein